MVGSCNNDYNLKFLQKNRKMYLMLSLYNWTITTINHEATVTRSLEVTGGLLRDARHTARFKGQVTGQGHKITQVGELADSLSILSKHVMAVLT